MTHLRFHAYGRDFDLDLQSNDRLKAGLAPVTQARLGAIRLYRGELDTYPGSWVRLTEDHGDISGVIWDGSSFYVLEQQGERYTLRQDDGFSTGSLVGDVVHPAALVPVAVGDRVPGTSALVIPLGIGKTIQIGVVADSAYASQRGDHAEAQLLESMNIVDGIFLWQLGVRISLAEIQILDALTDPFFDARGATFLDELGQYKRASAALAPLGLVHLFTGRELVDNDPQTDLVGVANIGAVCDTQTGLSITKGRSPTGDARVAAHEIAHNFGAPHDNETGSACAATAAGFLMERFDNGSREFSQCSIDQMLPAVETRGCFSAWMPSDLAVRVIDGPSEINLLTEPGVLSVALDNADTGIANAVELLVEMSDSIALSALREPNGAARIGFDCERTVGFGRCAASYMVAGATANFELELYTQSSDGGDVTVTVVSGNDPNSLNNSFVFPITVPPAADIAASVELLPGQARAGDGIFYPGDLVRLSATIGNLSSETATNAVALFDFSPSATDFEVTAPDGVECTVAPFGTRFECHLAELPGGEQISFGLSFRTQASIGDTTSLADDTVRMQVSADQHDPYRENNVDTDGAASTNGIFDLVMDVEFPEVIDVDTPATFTLTLENLGPDAARHVFLGLSDAFASPGGFEFLSVTSNLADCSRAHLQATWNCDTADALPSGDALVITYELIARRPLDFFALPRFEYVGYELGPNEELPVIRILAEEQSSGPGPQPEPTPQPTPQPPASGSSGGGGATSVPMLILLLAGLITEARRTRRRR
jgi:hypothetical protein